MRLFKILLLIVLAVVTAAYGTTAVSGYISGEEVGPVISCESDTLELSVQDDESSLLQGVTASDAQDGDMTGSILVGGISKFIDDATANVEYLVFDSDHNVGRLTRTIHYTDYHEPRISVTEPLIYKSSENIALLDRLYVEDCIDGDITDSVRVSSLNATTEEEVYTVTVRATNSMGDITELTLPIIRQNDNVSRPKVKLNTYVAYLSQGDTFAARDYLSHVETAAGITGTAAVRHEGTVNTDVPGVYTVRYSYTYDPSDNGFDDGVTGFSILTVVVE